MCNVWKLSANFPGLKENELSFEDYIKLFKDFSDMGIQTIWITGGEPTLREDIVDIVREAKKNDLNVALTTNGFSMNKKLATDLILSGLDSLEFSIDAPTAEVHDRIRGVKGAWEKATSGMKIIDQLKKEMAASKPSLKITYIVCRINYDLIDKMIDLRKELGYEYIDFIPLINKTLRSKNLLLTGRDLEKIQSKLPLLEDKLRENKLPISIIRKLSQLCENAADTVEGKYGRTFNKKILCFVPYESATIDPFGNVYPCCFACAFQNLSEDLSQSYWGKDDFNMGSIRDRSFKQIWNGEKYQQFRRKCKRPPSFPMCEWCQMNGHKSLVYSAFFYDRTLLITLVARKIRRWF
jgi:MoaA/NifB/PqqE/SkfB family radical SAM enzyme